MGSVAKHVFLVTDPTKLEATVRTAFEIARTGRPGPVVVDIPKDVQNWRGAFHGTGRLPVSGYRHRMNRLMRSALSDAQCAEFFAMLGEAQRPLIYAGGGVIHSDGAAALREFAHRVRHPGRDDADGPRRVRHDASAVDAHARHARRGVRQLRRRRLRLPVRARRALRRSRRRQSAEVRAERAAHRADRHRRFRDQQGEAGRAGSHVGLLPEALRALLALRAAQRLQARLVRLARALRGAATRRTR